jgi:hypothetical protein
MTVKQKIHNLEWGYIDIRSLTAEEIEEITEYYVPESVTRLCFEEIKRRRDMRIEQNRRTDK